MEEQKNFLPSNVFSIAQSKFIENMNSFAIYGYICMVGFTSYLIDDDGDMNLTRFMIDKEQQRKGYGKAALKEVIKLIKNNCDNKEIWISTHPKNIIALKLYISESF